jgi:hypothetical protein
MSEQRLGLHEILVSKGLVTEQKFSSALQHQLVYGGRLGTNLVELGYVRLDDLGHVLAMQLGVQHGEARALESIDPATLALVDPRLCVEDQIIPLRFEQQVLHLAMADPRPEHVVRLSSWLGCRIVPYVVPELRLLFYLERYYSIERPGRYLRAPDGSPQVQRRHYLTPTVDVDATRLRLPESEGSYRVSVDRTADVAAMVFSPVSEVDGIAGTLVPRGEAVRAAEENELVPLDEWPQDSLIFVDTSAFEELDEDAPSQAAAVLRRLELADGSAALTEALVAPLYPQAVVRLLFWVRGGHAIACRGAGEITRPKRVPELVVPVDKSLLLSWALESHEPVRANAAEDPLQPLIADYVGAPPPGEVYVAPVLLAGRTVHLLCFYSRQGRKLPSAALAELREISARTTAAYLRLRAAVVGGARAPHP